MEDSLHPDFPPDQFLERPLPHNVDAEKAVLGAIQQDSALISYAVDLLEVDDFYVPSHRRIYGAMLVLFQLGSDMDAVLIAEQLRKEGVLEQCGGVAEILQLSYGLPHHTNIAHYAKIIVDKSRKRNIIKACNKAVAEALADEDAVEIPLEALSKAIFEISLHSASKPFASAGTLIHRALAQAYAIETSGTAIAGLATGLLELDAITLGLRPTDYIVVAARPSMGKTGLVIQFAIHMGLNLGAKVAFFSLEQGDEQIGIRLACNYAKVDSQKMMSGHLNAMEWGALHSAQDAMQDSPIYVLDTPGISTLEIKARLRRFAVEKGGLDAVIIDYLQLMGSAHNSKRAENRQQEVSQISRELKALAKEFNVPFIILSQLSRAPENRTNHRPQLSDLRESGSIEQDADVVAFIYREDQYKDASDPSAPSNTAEIIVAKQRNGPTGVALLQFDKTTVRFNNLQHTYQEMPPQ